MRNEKRSETQSGLFFLFVSDVLANEGIVFGDFQLFASVELVFGGVIHVTTFSALQNNVIAMSFFCHVTILF